MFALDVSQINWRTPVAHLPTEDSLPDPRPWPCYNFLYGFKGAPPARRA
jgi:hypothetical protein